MHVIETPQSSVRGERAERQCADVEHRCSDNREAINQESNPSALDLVEAKKAAVCARSAKENVNPFFGETEILPPSLRERDPSPPTTLPPPLRDSRVIL